MKISLIERKLKDGSINLTIEYYKGSEITSEGKRKHIREYSKFINQYYKYFIRVLVFNGYLEVRFSQ